MKKICQKFCMPFLMLSVSPAVMVTALADEQFMQQQGDVLDMPEAVSNSPTTKRLPSNGMNKATVEKRYGTPIRKDSAVGDPPISVWYYDDFKVFFEYQLVLHSVSESRKPVVYTEAK